MITIPLFLGDVAGSEILLILVFILMFFGSKSIPGIARTMGQTIRQIKDASQQVQDEIKKSGGDIRADFNLQRMVDETRQDIERPFREHAKTLDQAINFEAPQSFVKPGVQLPAEDELANRETPIPAVPSDRQETASVVPEEKPVPAQPTETPGK